MKTAILILCGLMPVFGRVTATRLGPDAGVWFEPNAGQAKGRTEFVGAQADTFLRPQFGYSARLFGRSLGRGGVNGGLNPLYPIGGPRSVRLAPRLVFEGVMQG